VFMCLVFIGCLIWWNKDNYYNNLA